MNHKKPVQSEFWYDERNTVRVGVYRISENKPRHNEPNVFILVLSGHVFYLLWTRFIFFEGGQLFYVLRSPLLKQLVDGNLITRLFLIRKQKTLIVKFKLYYIV
jgi:hypothetical protein